MEEYTSRSNDMANSKENQSSKPDGAQEQNDRSKPGSDQEKITMQQQTGGDVAVRKESEKSEKDKE